MLQDAVPLAIELLEPFAMQTASDNTHHVTPWVSALRTAFAGVARLEKAAEKAGAKVKRSLNWEG